MKGTGAYGKTLARAMRVERASAFVSHSMLRSSMIAVTEIRSNRTDEQVTRPVASEDGILAMVQMADWRKRLLLEDGRAVGAQPLKAGMVTVFDLRKVWIGIRSTPVHYICFYLPRAALAEVAELEEVVLPNEFPNDYRRGNEDATLASLARMLLPSFACPDQANSLFVDHVTAAASAHILKRYGNTASSAADVSYKLSETDLNRSKDRLAGALDGRVTIRELAAECGLSMTGFTRAFRFTTGMDPHEWLGCYRMDLARSLVRNTRLTTAEIAASCGFRSEADLYRAFRKTTLTGPRGPDDKGRRKWP
jgi:AraC family transcriptional regulator